MNSQNKTPIQEYLALKKLVAETNTPPGMELVGWKVFGEDRISETVLLDSLARPVYAYQRDFEPTSEEELGTIYNFMKDKGCSSFE